jgi:hypothetical protein
MAAKTYSGGCHCKKVRYEVAADLDRVMSCNCSYCSARGLLLTFVPSGEFQLLAGEDDLSEYQFNKHVVHHLFCRHCSVQSFARGTGPNGVEMVAINVRCLDGVDVGSLTLTPYDGRSK